MEWILENLEPWRSLISGSENGHEYVLVNNTEKPLRLIVTNNRENRTVIVIKAVNK